MPAKPALEWRPSAEDDLADIMAYIAEDNPDAAQALYDEIQDKADRLPNHPKLYKASLRVPGMREMVIGRNYVVLYRETVQRVEIVAVMHTRQQLPR